jgi:hypothetical protein
MAVANLGVDCLDCFQVRQFALVLFSAVLIHNQANACPRTSPHKGKPNHTEQKGQEGNRKSSPDIIPKADLHIGS